MVPAVPRSRSSCVTPGLLLLSRAWGSAKIRAKAATGHNRALQDPFDLDSPQISKLLYITQSFLLPRLR